MIPVVLMLISSVGSALLVMFAKLLTRLKSPQICYYRSFTMLCINTLLIWRKKEEVYMFSRSVKYQLISRGIFGAIGGSLLFEGLKHITISENMVLMRTAPIWTALIVIFVTKQEKGSWNLLIAIALGFVGVLFVARPP